MTDHTPAPGAGDDVEGHAMSRRDMSAIGRGGPSDLTPGGVDAADVAGHGQTWATLPDAPGTPGGHEPVGDDVDDTEGHALSRRDMAHLRRDVPADLTPGGADADDVTGHGGHVHHAPGTHVHHAPDADDVTGHGGHVHKAPAGHTHHAPDDEGRDPGPSA